MYNRYQWQMGAWSECWLDKPGRLTGPGQLEGPGSLGGPGQLVGPPGRPGGPDQLVGPARLGGPGQPEEEEEESCGAGARHRNLTCLDTRAGTPASFHLCLQGPVVFANQLIER